MARLWHHSLYPQRASITLLYVWLNSPHDISNSTQHIFIFGAFWCVCQCSYCTVLDSSTGFYFPIGALTLTVWQDRQRQWQSIACGSYLARILYAVLTLTVLLCRWRWVNVNAYERCTDNPLLEHHYDYIRLVWFNLVESIGILHVVSLFSFLMRCGYRFVYRHWFFHFVSITNRMDFLLILRASD